MRKFKHTERFELRKLFEAKRDFGLDLKKLISLKQHVRLQVLH